MANLTGEQFSELLQAINQSNQRLGSFSSCTARFNGERSSTKVEEFLAAVLTFKAVEKISDSDAINGMPMVLEGDAAEWWQGVKSKAEAFSDVVHMLRQAFSPPKPSWRIYVEIFESKQQRNEPTDTFIRRKRALFSQLTNVPAEADQLDIVFGLLHLQIRDRVCRERIVDFDGLLKEAREAEMSLNERRSQVVNADPQRSSGPVRCSFCRKKGHTVESCFKRKNEEAKDAHAVMLSQAQSLKPKFACYGCNAPGVTRANCTNCTKKPIANPGTVNFNTINVPIGRDIPITNIQIFGIPGQAYFDSGARTSVASANLKKVMESHRCVFESVNCEVTLADGHTATKKCLSTICEIVIGGRKFDIQFIVLPNAENNRTLIGADFLEKVGIVMNMGQRYWYFEDEPSKQFDFVDALPLELNILEIVKVSGVVPKRKSQDDDFQLIDARNKRKPYTELDREGDKPRNYMSEFEYYGPEEMVTYSPHAIQSIFKDALPPNMVTPERKKEKELFNGVYRPISYVDLFSINFRFLKETDGVELVEVEKEQLDMMLNEFSIVSGASSEPTPYAQHFIDTGNHKPIALPPYRMSFPKLRELKDEISKMLDSDVIEECDSAWASPVVMVPKRDGSTRVCVDYRKLNSITKPDRYPIPRIDDLLHAAKSTKFMTTLDLECGYFQISVAEEDRDKTCLITPFGTYRFKRMPFGLRNAPATFQRLIDRFKTAVPNVQILAYLDDIIICSASFTDHMNDLRSVFEKLVKFKLRINMKKCRFCCTKVKYLGHVLTPEGIKVDPEKTSAITQRREPKNLKELISFIQTCSWYRRFIDQFAKIAKPLTDLFKKNAVWQWNDPHINAFNKLKDLLVQPPILKQAEDLTPFLIKTDASSYALGAVLLQREKNREHPIEFASRLLTPAERNYSTTEREALAIVWACAKFRGYIDGAEVHLMTDHQPLKWLMTMKSPSGRLARWALQIQQYNIKIEYTPGKSNSLADMLSRPSCEVSEHSSPNCICAFNIDIPKKNANEQRNEQLKDEYLKVIVKSLEESDENATLWFKRGYLLNDGVLFCYANDDAEDAQLVIPQHERLDILKTYHDERTAGHYGVERTIARISNRYFWPGMRADITKYTKNCIECQRYKATNMKPMGLLQTSVSKQRFEVVAVDLFGPLPKTTEGFQWILIVEDVATRWVEIFAMIEATAEMCAKVLINEIFLRYGVPRQLRTDNGVQFISAIMQQVTYCMGIQQMFTPVYHPEANPVERKNRDLKAQLSIFVQNQHNIWDIGLPAIRFAINTAKCQSTGYSAAYLTFGRELRTFDDVQHDIRAITESENFIPQITPYLRNMTENFKNAKEKESMMQDRNKKYVDKGRRPQEDITVGSEVLVKTHVLSNASKGVTSKFVPRRDGPYIVTRKIGASTYEVAAKGEQNVPLGTYHASALTLYKGSNNNDEVPTPVQPIRRRGRPKKKQAHCDD